MNVSYGMVFLSRAANERDEQLAGGFSSQVWMLELTLPFGKKA
jgi:hypothetical protein